MSTFGTILFFPLVVLAASSAMALVDPSMFRKSLNPGDASTEDIFVFPSMQMDAVNVASAKGGGLPRVQVWNPPNKHTYSVHQF